MSIISKTTSGLVQGVSQQDPLSRMPTQADLQINAISSAVLGLGKRPGSTQVGVLGFCEVNDKWHFIERDTTERYVVKFNSSGVNVWDLDGNAKTINYIGNAKAYLQSTNPATSIIARTGIDYTYVVNKQTPVGMMGEQTPVDVDTMTLVLPRPYLASDQVFTYWYSNPANAMAMTESPTFATFADAEAALLARLRSYYPDLGISKGYVSTSPSSQVVPQTIGRYFFIQDVAYYTNAAGQTVNAYKVATDGRVLSTNAFPVHRTRQVYRDERAYGQNDIRLANVGWPGVLYYNAGATATINGSVQSLLAGGQKCGIGCYRKDVLPVETGNDYSWGVLCLPTPPLGDLDALKIDITMLIMEALPRVGSDRYYPGNSPNYSPTYYPAGTPVATMLNEAAAGIPPGMFPAATTSVIGNVLKVSTPAGSLRSFIMTANLQALWGRTFLGTTEKPWEVATNSRGTAFATTATYSNNTASPAILAGKRLDRLFIVVKQGVASQKYMVSINGSSYTWSTGDTANYESYKLDAIASGLAGLINASGLYNVSRFGAFIVVEAKIIGATIVFDYHDTWNNGALYAMKNRVQAFSDLPATFIPDTPVEVAGQGGATGYFVHYTRSGSNTQVPYSSSTVGQATGTASLSTSIVTHTNTDGWTAIDGNESGIWEECPAIDSFLRYDPAVMPHALVREADGTFTFKELPWAARECGNDVSVPRASFVGQTIEDLFFWRGRLGIMTSDTVVLSRSGKFDNFWPKSAKSVFDSDPIDVSVTSAKATHLRYAVPFNQSLLLFSDFGLFQMGTSATVTPATTSAQQTLLYAISPLVQPVNTGETILFGSPRSGALAVYEADVLPNQYLTTAEEVTAHVPTYVPASITKFACSPSENFMAALTGSDNNMWIYQYLWNGDKKIQSAWHQWTFAKTPAYAEFFGSRLYVVFRNGTSHTLDYIELAPFVKDTGQTRAVYLDHKTYSGSVWTGTNYTMRYRLSPIYAKSQEGTSLPDVRLQMATFSATYSKDTTAFSIQVTPDKRPAKLHALRTPLTGTFRVPALSDAKTIGLELVNSTDAPSFFQSITWEAHQVMRSQKL